MTRRYILAGSVSILILAGCGGGGTHTPGGPITPTSPATPTPGTSHSISVTIEHGMPAEYCNTDFDYSYWSQYGTIDSHGEVTISIESNDISCASYGLPNDQYHASGYNYSSCSEFDVGMDADTACVIVSEVVTD